MGRDGPGSEGTAGDRAPAAAAAAAARRAPLTAAAWRRAGSTSTEGTSRRRGRRTTSPCRRTRTTRTATTCAGNATSCRACTTRPWWSFRRPSRSTHGAPVRPAHPPPALPPTGRPEAATRRNATTAHPPPPPPPRAGDYYGRGDCYRHQGKLDEAMAEYSQALQLDPKFAGACWGRGDCLLAQVRAPPFLCPRERAAALSGRTVRRGISTPGLRSSQLRWLRTPTTSERISAGQSACDAKGSCARQKCVAPNPKHAPQPH